MTPTSDGSAAQVPWQPKKRAFRPEIQGLRSLAVLLVAAYHIWFGRVSGGVDVFLFISAFLMALSFTGKLERGERIGWKALSTYWVHVFKRILPLAIITVIGVLAGTRLFLGAERWESILHEAVSVVFYYENWWSIANLVDYYADDSSAASPFRHFWSLSVQGQIFLAWPLLFALGGIVIRVLRLKARPVLAVIFGVVFAGSLAYSITETAAAQTTAYYNTFTRLWEFALGALVAIVLPWIKPPRTVRALMSWVGVVAILICGAVLDVQGMFPGYIALWPTLAASLVIIAGTSGTRWGIDRFLAWKPLVTFGGYSYALYLVHWPILVFFLAQHGQEKAGILSGVGILTFSLGLAVVLTKLVDAPLRHWKWAEAKRWRSLAVVACCLLLGVGAVTGWQARIQHVDRTLQAKAEKNNPGAEILDPDYQYEGDSNAGVLPTSVDRPKDLGRNYIGDVCEKSDPSLNRHGLSGEECTHVVKNNHPTKRVIAVGNSHTEQWVPALKARAEAEGWDLKTAGHGGCFFTTQEENEHAIDQGPQCTKWFKNVQKFIDAEHPDILVTQSTKTGYDGTSENIPDGVEAQVEKWTKKGIRFVGIRDNPRFTFSHAQCEEKSSDADCVFHHPAAETPDPTTSWKEKYPGYVPMDLNDLVCPQHVCPPAVGNVYVYADTDHLTSTFVKSTQKFFDQRFSDSMREADERVAQVGTGQTDPTSTPGP